MKMRTYVGISIREVVQANGVALQENILVPLGDNLTTVDKS